MVSLRCFFAIEITDEELKGKILSVQKELQTVRAKVKYVKIENIHITLKFLGDVEETQIPMIIKEVGEISLEPFDAVIANVGAFPKPTFPRVIWIGVNEGSEQVKSLSKKIDSIVSKFGFKREKRFSAHLTIGRVRERQKNQSLIKKLIEYQPREEVYGTMRVTSFQLKKSQLTPKGPIYTTIQDFPLREE